LQQIELISCLGRCTHFTERKENGL